MLLPPDTRHCDLRPVACSQLHRTFLRWDRQKVNVQTTLKSVKRTRFGQFCIGTASMLYISTYTGCCCVSLAKSGRLIQKITWRGGCLCLLHPPKSATGHTFHNQCSSGRQQSACEGSWVSTRGEMLLRWWWQCPWINKWEWMMCGFIPQPCVIILVASLALVVAVR